MDVTTCSLFGAPTLLRFTAARAAAASAVGEKAGSEPSGGALVCIGHLGALAGPNVGC